MAIKKNELMLFVATWMHIEIIILSEIRERQTSYNITYVWNIKKKLQNELVNKRDSQT